MQFPWGRGTHVKDWAFSADDHISYLCLCILLFVYDLIFVAFFVLTIKETKSINIWSALSLFPSFWFLPQDFASLPCPTPHIFLVLFINLCFLCHDCPFLSFIIIIIIIIYIYIYRERERERERERKVNKYPKGQCLKKFYNKFL